ncbi:TPA: trp operon leader peptide [Enterobacter hormaechei]|uniref:trp operon leader peptide n=9 Tax=Enterobacter TaxID=547 RepID=A0AAE8UBS1_9ENTR|nr:MULTISPECIES: trp operon leader peptide [Enterobacteriaceae]MBE3300397.1 trp operon leader peptide [Enterobacter cloacae complex sp. P30U]MBE4901866.1 trp operon leader peptide [Enterobacter cloacae complex sp. P8RS]MBU5510722.1 trp operon leader peptide [Enterobacteriaceae bacterium S18_ASV_15]MBU5538941.1 trp operon leader peptide [Pluralibacter sp. S10_ASV_43]MBU5619659.1 trp operon leader peptide [Enterobacteriaceae bacterium S5_ASV_15]MBU5630809.1 trp operon leader peptide [Enterobact
MTAHFALHGWWRTS